MINDLKSRELERLFNKLEIEMTACAHHVRGFLFVDGKAVLPVHYSNGNKGLHGPNLHKFRKSLRLNNEQFVGLVSCTFSRADLVKALREQGVI
jgi:hypothetical protein